MIEDGLHTEWWENGQKKLEVTYKNGKPDGLGMWWNVNGQMKSKGTYNAGELISQEFWDENGNKKD